MAPQAETPGANFLVKTADYSMVERSDSGAAEVKRQNDPKIEPRTMTTTKATIVLTITVITMSK